MSYDLAVWEGDRPTDDAAAAVAFERLYNEYVNRDDLVAPTQRIEAYVRALLSRYPDLGEDGGDDGHEDASPWSSGPLIGNASGPLFYFGMRWNGADPVSEWAADLAAQHGLNCFDPQWNRLRTEMGEGWRFKLESERGQTLRDPGRDSMRRVLTKLSRDNYYAVLERVDGWYVQVGVGERAGTRSGWYALERRDGSPDRHYRVEVTDVEAVCRAFVAFMEDDQSLSTLFAWRPHTV